MTDIVTYCDVNTCEDCPRYGDDCDGRGEEEMDNCQVQVPQNYMQQSRHDDGTDLISRADAVHGEWEHWGSPFSDESEVIDTIVCSVCGARFIEPKDEPKGEYNYCPNCGARMENTK